MSAGCVAGSTSEELSATLQGLTLPHANSRHLAPAWPSAPLWFLLGQRAAKLLSVRWIPFSLRGLPSLSRNCRTAHHCRHSERHEGEARLFVGTFRKGFQTLHLTSSILIF